MPAGELEDRISTGWVGEQYLLGPRENLKRLIVLVPPHLGCPEERAVKHAYCCCWLDIRKGTACH